MFLIVVITVLFAVILFRLLFSGKSQRHSLPLPPGPKPWPIVGNLPHLGSFPHHSLANLAQKHGPLMAPPPWLRGRSRGGISIGGGPVLENSRRQLLQPAAQLRRQAPCL
ncbi:hypothetical protein M0R45_023353 [Rubus argutus]|uniref:Uncharacterized protein n=1 Tax=Rubus argutus TaxID=59490 RepID=A0AAW1WPX7_RUBAR